MLIKTFKLPPNVVMADEEKLQAEHRSLRMKFVLSETLQEAERKRNEAARNRTAQQIPSQGLAPQILRWKSIQAFLALAKSPNSKVIISYGDHPKQMLPALTTDYDLVMRNQ